MLYTQEVKQSLPNLIFKQIAMGANFDQNDIAFQCNRAEVLSQTLLSIQVNQLLFFLLDPISYIGRVSDLVCVCMCVCVVSVCVCLSACLCVAVIPVLL